MSKRLYKLTLLASLALITVVYTNCGSPFGKQTSLAFQGNVYGGPDSVSYEAFERTVYPITRVNCISCHANTQPKHANNNPIVAHDEVISQFKVNFANIGASRLVAKLRSENHNCWSNCEDNALELEDAIEEWKAAIASSGPPSAPPVDTTVYTNSTRNLISEFSDPAVPLKSNTHEIFVANATLTAPMSRLTDANGTYLSVPNDGSNQQLAANAAGAGIANLSFRVPVAGTYSIWGLVHAPTNNDNGFYVSVSSANPVVTNRTWDPTVSAQVSWRMIPGTFSLAAGNHSLQLRQREDGTKIYRIIVTTDAAFNGVEPDDFFGKTLSFDLSNHLQVSNVSFQIDVVDYDAYSYKFSRPRIVSSSANVWIKGIKLLVNGLFTPQHSTYTIVDKVTTPSDGLLSNYSMVVLKDRGPSGDKISFAIDEVSISYGGGTTGGGTGGSPDSLTAYTNTVYQVSRTSCIECHNTRSPKHAADDNLIAHDAVINQGLVNFTTPATSRLVQKVRGGHNCGNTASCTNIANQFQSAIEEWKIRRQ